LRAGNGFLSSPRMGTLYYGDNLDINAPHPS
jgi:hypothetical protein